MENSAQLNKCHKWPGLAPFLWYTCFMKNGFKINENTSGQKGQSTFEYILLFTAVVVVLVVFLKPGGYYQKTVEDTIDHGQNHLLNMANLIFTNQ